MARVRESLRSVRSGTAAASGAGAGGAAALDPRELDPLLGELTILHARTELYVRFVRRRVVVSGGGLVPARPGRVVPRAIPIEL